MFLEFSGLFHCSIIKVHFVFRCLVRSSLFTLSYSLYYVNHFFNLFYFVSLWLPVLSDEYYLIIRFIVCQHKLYLFFIQFCTFSNNYFKPLTSEEQIHVLTLNVSQYCISLLTAECYLTTLTKEMQV